MTIQLKTLSATMGCLTLLALTAACVQTGIQQGSAAPDKIRSAFIVQAEDGKSIVRVVTEENHCPTLEVEGKPQAMLVRAAPAIVAARGGAQPDSKEAAFPVLTCEAGLPRGTDGVRVGSNDLPAPRADIQRIVIVGDTGCRMKQSDNAFQACNDSRQWPFAKIAQSAAALKPDLVIHVGDIHYRESPCPAGNPGCANSPWGYGYDAWEADLFRPAAPLLAAAPWVFVRGNHESCSRAGQGWFRFVDGKPWSAARSCNDPRFDSDADYSDPYAVPITSDTQLIVFDSSKTGGKPYGPKDEAYKKYLPQMEQVSALARQARHSFFLNHHPVLGFAPAKDPATVNPGNKGLQSIMNIVHPERLFPAGVDVAMHGHIHLFQSIGFLSNHPATFVLGNSGSAADAGLPEHLPANAQPAPGAIVKDFTTRSEYGFATLDRVDGGWQLTERDIDGQAVLRCDVRGAKTRCGKAGG